MKLFSLIALIVLSVFVLMSVGCNTMNGLGKDLQSWTADESHGHNMAQQNRRQELNGNYHNTQYNR